MERTDRYELEPRAAERHLGDGALLLDVREPEEWTTVHVADARHIPLAELEQRFGELPRDREIIVICRSGRRSAKAQDALEAAGFRPVANLAGGILAWEDCGLPVARSAENARPPRSMDPG